MTEVNPQPVLFFCTGNTCRSPLAEVLARLRVRAGESPSTIRFLSAGIQAIGGQPASSGSLQVAKEAGADLSAHASQVLSPELLADVGWAIGMTRSHVALFKSRYGGFYRGRLGVLGEPGVDVSERRFSEPIEEVADPFGGSLDTYRQVGRQIDRLVASWLPYF